MIQTFTLFAVLWTGCEFEQVALVTGLTLAECGQEIAASADATAWATASGATIEIAGPASYLCEVEQ